MSNKPTQSFDELLDGAIQSLIFKITPQHHADLKANITQVVKQLVEGVIGPDATEEDDSTGKYKVNKYLVAENRLRRQQRAALLKALGGKK
jgi:hypothetical protein